MIQHEYWIIHDHEKKLIIDSYYAWFDMVKKQGFSTLKGWLPDGVKYMSMRDYANA